MDISGLQQALKNWYARSHRELAWRRYAEGRETAGLRPHPAYAVWVSEVMLQQTRIETVESYYPRFLARFPTVQALAAADLEDVLEVWAGLGYYARARNLHVAAQMLARKPVEQPPTAVTESQAKSLGRVRFPRGYDEWLTLPGIGPYTAAAISSIVDGAKKAVLDGNVIRVLSRLAGEEGDITRAATARRLKKMAGGLVPAARPGDHNQALMELGQTLCVPQNPHCLLCPIHGHCEAHRRGLQNVIPRRRDRLPVKTLRFFSAVVRRRDGAILLARRPVGGLWGGLWEVPNCPAKGRRGQKMLTDFLREEFHIQARLGRCLGRLHHLLTHRRVRFMIYPAAVEQEGQVPENGHIQTWCRPDDWPAMAISAATRKILEMAAKRNGS